MKIISVDIYAVQGRTYFHQINVYSKLIATALILTAIIFTTNLNLVVILGSLLISILLFLVKISFIQQLLFYIYPLFFSLIYGKLFLDLDNYSLILIVMKAVTAVMILLLLISTTPYVKIFAAISKLTPGVLVDIFFLTYRAFFLLLNKIRETLVSIKLKGGMSGISLVKRIKNMGSFLGLAFVKALDLNERNYWLMVARGYEGKMMVSGEKAIGYKDVPIMVLASLFFILAVFI